MDPDGQQEIIDNICKYAEEKQLKKVFHEYLKRLILEKPSDPIQFLIESIETNPFEPEPELAEHK